MQILLTKKVQPALQGDDLVLLQAALMRWQEWKQLHGCSELVWDTPIFPRCASTLLEMDGYVVSDFPAAVNLPSNCDQFGTSSAR